VVEDFLGINFLSLSASYEPKEAKNPGEVTKLVLSHCGLKTLPPQIGFDSSLT